MISSERGREREGEGEREGERERGGEREREREMCKPVLKLDFTAHDIRSPSQNLDSV